MEKLIENIIENIENVFMLDLAVLFEKGVSFIVYPPPHIGFLIIKIIFITTSLLFLSFIVFALLKSSWLKFHFLIDLYEFFNYRPYGMPKLTKKWLKIKARSVRGTEDEYKLAIIEADSLLDEILKKIGYEEEELSGKLNKIPAGVLPNIEEILQAHKIRNDIIYDPNYKLSLEETEKILAIFEKALTDLHALT